MTANFKAKKKVKSIKILHLPVLRKLKRAQRGRKIVNGKSDLEISDDRYDNSDFDEGGQIPELFGGEDLDPDQISALFENTKDLEVYGES